MVSGPESPEPTPDPAAEDVPTTPPAPGRDPLRRSRVSYAWVSVVVFALLLTLLIVFFAQNTGRVDVRFFGWTWHAPLAVVALSAVVTGMILTLVAGTLRIVQLRHRVRRSS